MAWALAVILGVLGVSGIFIYLAIMMDKKNSPLKLLFLIVALFNIMATVMISKYIAEEFVTNASLSNILDHVFNGTMWVGIFVIAYFVLMLLYNVLLKFAEVARGKKYKEEYEE
jgi:hypothetical protein